MAIFFCEHCKRETKFLAIRSTIRIAGISRSTVYYWMEHAWVHWRVLASGRRVICQESLSHRAPQQNSEADPLDREIVRKYPIPSNPVSLLVRYPAVASRLQQI